MCLSPINIYNPSKYISLKHADAFTFSVPCGQCSECQEIKHNEYYFRTHYEFLDCLKHGGYVLFDTLTYRNSDLPHLSDIYPDIPSNLDFPCFNREHIRYFLVRLRRRLDYLGLSKIRTFLTSEYGVDPTKSHRPHYHILIFVQDKNLDPILLSRLVHESWSHGRTDGVFEYGSRYVLENRVFNDYSAHGMQLANYVSKYVQKDSSFERNIQFRLDLVTRYYFPLDDSSDFGLILEARSFRTKLKNKVCQFHLQSQGFGLGFFDSDCYNLDSILTTGMVRMRVPKLSIYKHIPLPTYYFRFLFMDFVKVNGKRVWILNDLGKKFRILSRQRNIDNYSKHVSLFVQNLPSLNLPVDLYNRVIKLFDIDYSEFADYVLFRRGRFVDGVLDYSNIVDKFRVGLTTQDSFDFFHYGTANDCFAYGRKFVSSEFLGNDVLGYEELSDPELRNKFLHRYCYFNPKFERVYLCYCHLSQMMRLSSQVVFDKKQYLNNLYKIIFAR